MIYELYELIVQRLDWLNREEGYKKVSNIQSEYPFKELLTEAHYNIKTYGKRILWWRINRIFPDRVTLAQSYYTKKREEILGERE